MSLKDDHRRAVPTWLAAIKLPNPVALQTRPFPLQDVLDHSLYYPAAGFDGRPVQFLAGFIHSFIYVDYGESASRLDSECETGFAGYHIAGRKSLKQADLAPSDWVPRMPPRFRDEGARIRNGQARGRVKPPFASWYIFDRDPKRDDDHGPARFSLVYIGGDGIATYQALYRQNDTAPEVLVIIQPGTGFGGNYSDFRNPKGFLAWTVLDDNPARVPEYLVYGGQGLDYREACWPDAYPEHVEWIQRENGNGIWRRRENRDPVVC